MFAWKSGEFEGTNVFLADDWTSIQLDREAEEFEEARTKRQRKKLERG